MPGNPDRLKAVRGDDPAMHVWLELVREKDPWLSKGTGSRKHVNLYFSLPAGSDLPTVDEALDAVISDAIGFEDAPGTWKRPRYARRGGPDGGADGAPGLEAWATDNGYALGSAETDFAYDFVRKRSGKLRGLGSQDLYHGLLWHTGRLHNNRWGKLLNVTGQIPPR